MGIILVITVGIPILRFIKPDVHLERKLMIGVALYQFMLKYRNCYTSYFSCTNRIPYVRAFLMSSLLCVCLAYTGLKMFDIGITWLVLAQIISQGIYNFWYWARRAHIELELSIKDTICLGIEELFGIIVSFVRKGETNNVDKKKILVIGDIMLDIYYRGEVNRISPEAPVPVFKKTVK